MKPRPARDLKPNMVTGQTLIAWGYPPGQWFGRAIMEAERARRNGASDEEQRAIVARFAPPPTASSGKLDQLKQQDDAVSAAR